jgi:sialate O-acetylesterase
MRFRWFSAVLAGLSVFGLSGVAGAEVRLPHVLSDHAVLQRDQPVRIWGWGAPQENVTVTFHEQKVVGQADAWGAWQVWLKPEKAGGPYELTVTGDVTAAPLKREDILVGDVWIASGQSNMQFPLAGFDPKTRLKNGDAEIAAANHPNIRLLRQANVNSPYPLVDSKDTWSVCTPDSARWFSAVAYFFGRNISDEEKVPVGLIDSSWGGSVVQSWISSEGLAWGGLGNEPSEMALAMRDAGNVAAIRDQWAIEDAANKTAGKPAVTHPRPPRDHAPFSPSVMFNGMIAPYVNYTIKGALWYQGESEHDVPNRYLYYSRAFETLIEDWRRQWGEGNFPFLYVQIASFGNGDGWALVRDQQRRVLELRETGMAVALDVGDELNIHPPDKQTVAARLSQSAMGMVYGRKVETMSPVFVEATSEGNSIRAWFTHAEGLKPSGAAVGEFDVAGDDHHFFPATAEIEKVGDQVTVVATAPQVAHPIYVRYGWAGTVKNYLYNASGLPLGTFTSETDERLLEHQWMEGKY